MHSLIHTRAHIPTCMYTLTHIHEHPHTRKHALTHTHAHLHVHAHTHSSLCRTEAVWGRRNAKFMVLLFCHNYASCIEKNVGRRNFLWACSYFEMKFNNTGASPLMSSSAFWTFGSVVGMYLTWNRDIPNLDKNLEAFKQGVGCRKWPLALATGTDPAASRASFPPDPQSSCLLPSPSHCLFARCYWLRADIGHCWELSFTFPSQILLPVPWG